MYGWRARIGHVAPSRGDILVYEFHKMSALADDYRRTIARREIGKPVMTSSLACSWYAMKLIDIKERVVGFGSLMASLGV